MSKTKISEFSTTPGNNTDINGINIAEGCAPSGINNAIRELMSDLKEWQSGAMDVYVIPQGTAAAPGIQLYGDLDTGLYGFAANQLGVAVGGASAGYFSSDGWVGNVVATTVDLTNIEVTNIKAKDGTTSISLADSTGIATFSKATVIETTDNTNAALRITQLGTGNALLVEDATNPDTTPTVIDQFGNVILGTTARTTPVTSKIEIHGTASELSGLSPSLGFYHWSATASLSSTLTFRHYPSGTVGTLAANTLGDVLGRVVFLSYDGTNAFGAVIRGVSGAGGTAPSITYDASGGHNFTSGPIDVENLEVTNIKARDGTAAASIADSTGVMTIASSVLTTTDINGGTIDGAVIGGSSAAAGTFTTITGTQVNSDNLRLDGNTLSSTDTNGNITIAPNGTGQVVMSGDLDVANIETGAIKARDGTAGATIANSTGQFTFSANIKRGVLELGQPTGITIAMIKATNTNGSIILQTNGTGSIFNYADETVLVPSGATAKLITENGTNFEIEGYQETGTFTVGGTAQTGTQTIGRSTKTHTLNLGTGATESGLTKTINLGTGGVATSTTAITIGSTNGTSTTLNGTVTAATFNSTTIDTTNLEVTNIKAKDGTAALSIADSTGVVSVSANPVLSGGTANGVVYLNASKSATSGSALVFDGTVQTIGSATSQNSLFKQVIGSGGANEGVVIVSGATGKGWLGFNNGNNANIPGQVTYNFSNNTLELFSNGGPIAFSANGSERMRLNSTSLNIGGNFTSTNNTLQVTGNAAIGDTLAGPTDGLYVKGSVGIGTNSPSFKLSVAANTVSELAIQAVNSGIGNTGYRLQNSLRSWAIFVNDDSSGPLRFYDYTAAAERMRIDSSGNLGIGVTPSAWVSGYSAMQIGPGATVNSTSDGRASISSNIFVGSGPAAKYIANGFGSAYTQLNGAHLWLTAPNNTSGANVNASGISTVMTLDASGNLGVGATSPSDRLHVNSSSAATYVRVTNTTGDRTFVGVESGLSVIYAQTSAGAAAPLAFFTGPTERARITSGGDLLVGTTVTSADVAGFRVFSSGRINASDSTVPGIFARLSSDGECVRFQRDATDVGSIDVTTTSTSYNTSSDYRLKDNPQPLTNSGAFIDALKPKTWDWKADGSKGVGFIAHEVQEVSPGTVVGDKDAVDADGKPVMQAMEYGSAEFIANIVAELQSLRARVAQLEQGA